MQERHWELYRLSVVAAWPDSPFKQAVIAAIHHRLRALEQPRAAAKAAGH